MGTLLCQSNMGLSPMDVFNDVLTESDNLQQYLGDDNYSNTDNAALSIKSYLKFCHDMDVPHWRPDQTDNAEIKGEMLSEEITYEDAEDFDIVDVKTEPTMFDGKVFSILLVVTPF